MLHDNDHDTTYGAALVLIMAKQMRHIVQDAEEEDEVTIMTDLLDGWAENLILAVTYAGVPAKEVVRTAEKIDTHVKAQYIIDKSFEEEEELYA